MKLSFFFSLTPFTFFSWVERKIPLDHFDSFIHGCRVPNVQLNFLCLTIFFSRYCKMQRKRSWRIPKVFRQCVLDSSWINIKNSLTIVIFLLFRYVPPINASTSPNLPETVEEIHCELRKQESLLSQIHTEMNSGVHSKKREEELWETQRIITQLKVQ